MIYGTYPPEQAGDAILGEAGMRYDLELVRDRNHSLFNASPTAGFTFFGILASHDVSGSRIKSSNIKATPESTIDIMKPVVDEVGGIAGDENAISFARGVFQGLRGDFPDFRDVDDSQQHRLFQKLISGVSEEAAEAIRQR
jgi:hypothetical protein